MLRVRRCQPAAAHLPHVDIRRYARCACKHGHTRVFSTPRRCTGWPCFGAGPAPALHKKIREGAVWHDADRDLAVVEEGDGAAAWVWLGVWVWVWAGWDGLAVDGAGNLGLGKKKRSIM